MVPSGNRIGFKRAKSELLEALEDPATLVHDQRTDKEAQNLLFSEQVTVAEVVAIVRSARGNEHEERDHDQAPGVSVHVIKTSHGGTRWYIKWYVLRGTTHILSVHEQQPR